jgi:hypothetical protein
MLHSGCQLQLREGRRRRVRGCPKRHSTGRIGSASAMSGGHPRLGAALEPVGFIVPVDAPAPVRALDHPDDLFSPERLGQHIGAAEVDHVSPEVSGRLRRGDDDGRRPVERAGGPKDILPGPVRQGACADDDRSEREEIGRIAASGADERPEACLLQDGAKDGPAGIIRSDQEDAGVLFHVGLPTEQQARDRFRVRVATELQGGRVR